MFVLKQMACALGGGERLTAEMVDIGRYIGLELSATRDLNRQPHSVTDRDPVCFERSVSPVGSEHVPFDAIHPEAQSLIKAEVVDVGSRSADYNLKAAFDRGAL